MTHIYSSDKPVNFAQDDRFQRYKFSARIAETIMQRKTSDGIVIGIYGAWGEGKTSVLNFIENELKNDTTIISIKFNPWRYSDEDTLIKGYFLKIAKALGQELETKTEKVGTILKRYGNITDFFGVNLSAIGNVMSDIDLEKLKDRIDEFLTESKSKLVIFVDDIDRLDKQELYSLFKLVKLTADFQNTIYILSFDERMVASAIGERFGAGNSDAGHNFLEKIIQVPLQIPKAQVPALKKYCFNMIDSVLDETNLNLSKSEIEDFVFQFTQNVLLRLKTPRLAVRYINTLSFSIPLLKGEVNHTDLLLVEAIKIFYPNHYEFIKYNSHYFITSYTKHNTYMGEDVEKKKNELMENLEFLAKDLSPQEKSSIQSLLKHLFPRLEEAFHNTFRHNAEREYSTNKRIVSPNYFNRYFLYSIIEGELSDVFFDNFSSSIINLEMEEIQKKIAEILITHEAETFLFKAGTLENSLDWESKKKLIYALTYSENLFPQNDESVFSFGMRGPHTQLCILISQFLRNSSRNTNEIFNLVLDLINKAKTLDFVLEIRIWLGIGGNDKILSEDQERKINQNIIKKVLTENKDIPLFEVLETNTYSILKIWAEINIKEVNNYHNKIIKKNPEKSAHLLYVLTSTMLSSTRPKAYKIDFDKESFDFVVRIVDKKLIYNSLLKVYKKEIEQSLVEFVGREDKQTFINILRQFEYWYLNDLKKKKLD